MKKYSMLQDYLFRGPQRVSEYQLFLHSKFPPNCPWASFNELTIEQAIRQNFHEIADKIPRTMESLSLFCSTIYSLEANGRWYLIYKLIESTQPADNFLVGGAPEVSSSLSNATLRNQWKVPNSLAAFYQVHDGFGLLLPFGLFWNSDCILPRNRLNPLRVSFPHLENSSFDLLEFFPDGAGNSQCFSRSSDSLVEITVDWDHETREISRERGFWDFIDNQFQRLIATGR